MTGDNISTNMGNDKVVKVLDIRVNYNEAIKELGIYRKSLDDTTKAEKQLKQELKDGTVTEEAYAKQMSALTQNKKALQAATRDVTRAVQNNIKVEKEQEGSLVQLRAKLSTLTQAYDRLGKAARNGIEGSRLKAQINDITKTIKDAEIATQRFYRNVGNYQSALQGLRDIGGAFKVFGGVVTGVIGSLGLEQLAENMIEVAKNFEDAIARVRSVANPNEGEFTQLRDKAMELGRTTRYTATEVANAMEELARKGYDAAEVQTLVGETLKMAQANVVSMADASTIATNSMRAFGLEAEEIGRVADVMSSACSHSATNLTQLGEAMKTAAPVARSANMTLEQTVSIVGSLANIGMVGSDAGTGVKQIIMGISTMAKSTDKARKVLEHYNLDITEARMRSGELMEMLKEMKQSGIGESIADLKIVAGKYAAPRLANLINNVDDAIELEKTLEASIGENERMYEQSIGQTSQALYMLKSAWEALLIEMYDSTSQYLVKPLQWLTEAIRAVSENISLLGQTITSVAAGVMAMPIWKGLKGIGGFFVATWQQVKYSAIGNMGELESAYAVAQENLVALKQKEAAIETQIDAANARRAAAWEAQKTVTHQKEELKRTTATKVENAKRAMEEATNAARAAGASRKAVAEIVRTHKAGIDTILRDERVAIRNLDAQYAKHVEARIKAEATITEATAAQAATRTDIAAAESAERAALAAKTTAAASAPSLTSWAGFWAMMKGGFKAIGSMLKSFLPLAIIFGISELYQGLSRIMEQFSELADYKSKVDEKVENAATTDQGLQKLTAMKDMLAQIRKEQALNGKLNDKQAKQLQAIAARLNLSKKAQKEINEELNIQEKTYEEINKAIEEQKKKIAELAKLNALKGIITDSQTELAKVAAKYGVKELDPAAIDQGMNKIWEQKDLGTKFWNMLTNVFGSDNIWADVQKTTALRRQYEYAMSQFIKAGGTFEEETPKKTSSGLYNPSDVGGGRESDRNADAWIAKLRKLIEDLSAETNTDQRKKEEDKLRVELAKFNIDTDKNWDTYAKAFLKHPEQRLVVIDLVNRVRDLYGLKEEQGLQLIDFKYEQKERDNRIKHLETKIAGTKKFEGSVDEAEGTASYTNLERLYGFRRLKRGTELEKSEADLLKQYMTGEFGSVLADADYDDIVRELDNKLKEYLQGINTAKEKGASGEWSPQQVQAEIFTWQKEYKPEMEYYNRLLALRQQYGKDMSAINKEYYTDQESIYQQRIQNEIAMESMKYEMMLDMAYDYYEDLQMVTQDLNIGEMIWKPEEQYWTELAERIGEFEAKGIQLEWESAMEELRSIKEQGWDEQAESYEAYQARIIAAQSKVMAAHTKANGAIEESDQTRFQATQTVTEGLIKLTEELGQEDKEAAKLAKTLALFNIMVNTAEAIAKMTSRESGKGVIGIGTAAAGIATILANMASAISILKQAKYAKGAVNIGGAGTETSDSIPAYISRGESVMNAKATKMFEPLLIAMNAIGNGVALPRNNYVRTQQTADITEAFTEAVANVRPVVDVREITNTQNRVEVLQNLDSL